MKDKLQYFSLDWLYDPIVSMLRRLILLLSYDMRKKQSAKKLKSLGFQYHCILLGLEVWIWARTTYESLKPNSLESGNRNLDKAIFKLKLWKKAPEVETFSQLCNMTSSYLGRLCIHFLELFFLKYIKNAVFSFKNAYNKEKGSFLFESDIFCYVWWLPFVSKQCPG